MHRADSALRTWNRKLGKAVWAACFAAFSLAANAEAPATPPEIIRVRATGRQGAELVSRRHARGC